MTQINKSLENINCDTNKENKENLTIIMDYSNENSMSFKNKNKPNLNLTCKNSKFQDKNPNITNNNQQNENNQNNLSKNNSFHMNEKKLYQ